MAKCPVFDITARSVGLTPPVDHLALALVRIYLTLLHKT